MTKQDKINFIKEWYVFRKNMCEKHNTCAECPLYESSDGWPDENGKYEYVDNCKYDFEDAYTEEIVKLIESMK